MDLTRVTVNLTGRSVTAMDRAAARTGHHRTDTINRALQVYDLVVDLMGDNTYLTVVGPSGRRERIHVL